jgi:hypothetical protein
VAIQNQEQRSNDIDLIESKDEPEKLITMEESTNEDDDDDEVVVDDTTKASNILDEDTNTTRHMPKDKGNSKSAKKVSFSPSDDDPDDGNNSGSDDEAPCKIRKEKKMKKLAKLFSSILESDGESDTEDGSENESKSTRPSLAKKTLPEFGDKEKFSSFYITFKQQVGSWKVKEDSDLFREYFETAIRKNNFAKSEYWRVRSRHPTWSMKQVSSWIIKKIDNI